MDFFPEIAALKEICGFGGLQWNSIKPNPLNSDLKA